MVVNGSVRWWPAYAWNAYHGYLSVRIMHIHQCRPQHTGLLHGPAAQHLFTNLSYTYPLPVRWITQLLQHNLLLRPHRPPLPSSRQYLSCDACLEVKREDNQNCSVLCCVRQLCTTIRTQMWVVLTVLWTRFCHTGPISLCVDLCLYFVSFCFTLHSCIIVSTVGWTWWDWSLVFRNKFPSVLWHCWLGHLIRKNPSPIWPIMCLVGR